MKVVVANGFVQAGRHEDEGVVHLVFRLDPGETPSIESEPFLIEPRAHAGPSEAQLT